MVHVTEYIWWLNEQLSVYCSIIYLFQYFFFVFLVFFFWKYNTKNIITMIIGMMLQMKLCAAAAYSMENSKQKTHFFKCNKPKIPIELDSFYNCCRTFFFATTVLLQFPLCAPFFTAFSFFWEDFWFENEFFKFKFLVSVFISKFFCCCLLLLLLLLPCQPISNFALLLPFFNSAKECNSFFCHLGIT